MAKPGGRQEEGLQTKPRQKTERPHLYKVLLLNDDYTTMDFVVYVLENIFHKPVAEATRIMLHVHRQGAGLAGVYTRDIAETKIDAVHQLARENEFPLRCVMEKE
jgi:ATP-dependent Clp protease adaptor protein ClpS